MIKPAVSTRTVKTDDLQAWLQNSRKVCSFRTIAQDTGASKITWGVFTFVFLTDNVFDLVWQISIGFVQKAVFAQVKCPLKNKAPGSG